MFCIFTVLKQTIMTTTNLKLPTTLTETFCFLTRLAMDSGMNEQEAKQEAKNVINILTLN